MHKLKLVNKLLFITPIFPSSKEEDTIVPFIYQFTDQFSKKYPKTKIDVLAINYPYEKELYQIDNITIYSTKGKFKKGIHSYIRFIKAVRLAFKLYRKHRYTSILSFWYGTSAMIGKLLKLVFRCQHKIWMQGQDVKSNNWYLKLFPSKGEDIIVLGANHQTLLSKNHSIKTENIAHVAINKDSFPKLKTSERSIDIIGVGNLGPIKNYSKFIDIIFEVRKSRQNLKVVLCGDGEEKEFLMKKVSQLNLTDIVHITGYISNEKVKELLNDSKIFLHTSTFEGGPMVIQEALFSGCSIVSSLDIQEGQQTIKNFYFIEDLHANAQKIVQLIENDANNYSRVHHFKIENTISTVYNLLLDNSSKAS